MKKKLHYFKLLLLLFGIIPCAHSQWQNGLWTQKQAYNWPFAHGLKLDFNTTPPTVGTSAVGHLDYTTGGASSNGAISDENGNLLIYNGPEGREPFHMFNGNNTIMPNGNSLSSSTLQSQSGIIIPKPQDPDVYYVFTQSYGKISISSSESGLYYSVVDMSLDGGLGDVTVKNDTLSKPAGDFQTAVHHANQKDVWLIANRGGALFGSTVIIGENGEPITVPGGTTSTNEYMAFLITEDGITTEPVISSVGDLIPAAHGSMKASPNGRKVAVYSQIAFGSILQVFDFDTSTGELTNPINLSSTLAFLGGTGIEFSPNGRFLYVAQTGIAEFSVISQFDLEAGDESAILASEIILYEEIDPWTSGMQVGPDGKIYVISTPAPGEYSSGVSTINYPNNLGEAAGFELFSTITPFEDTGNPENNVIAGPYFPGFIQSYFESGILYKREGDCPNEDITFSTIRIPGIDSIAWDFGDGQTGTGLTSTHSYAQGGTYTVTATITSNNAEQTATTEITVLESPFIDHSIGLIGCSPFDLTSISEELDSSLILDYYETETDAADNTNAIDNPTAYLVSSNETTIYIRITDTNGCVGTAPMTLRQKEDCVIPRGISPNGDGDNDSFDLSGFGVRKLSIFNRYGTKVYSRMDYTNQWSGQSDNGHELPTGTYFYVVEAGQDGNKTGWVYINR